jgi:hypothetical protein
MDSQVKHERYVFEWLAEVQYQARCYGHSNILLRAQVVDDRVELAVLTRSLRLSKEQPNWFMLACTGDWREWKPQRPVYGVTWTRYSCTLGKDAMAHVLARFVLRAPARRQQQRRATPRRVTA